MLRTLLPAPAEKYWEYKEIFSYIFLARLLCFHLLTFFLKGFLVLRDLLKTAFEKSSKENSLKISKNNQIISAYRIDVFA